MLTFTSPFKLKCVKFIHRLIVPNRCSASVFLNLNFPGCYFIRSAIASIKASWSSRVMLRLPLFRVHWDLSGHVLQPFAR